MCCFLMLLFCIRYETRLYRYDYVRPPGFVPDWIYGDYLCKIYACLSECFRIFRTWIHFNDWVFQNENLCKDGSLPPWHGTSLSCGWRKLPPDMDGSLECIEQDVAVSRHGVVLQFGFRRQGNNSS